VESNALLPYKVVHSVGNLLIQLSENEKSIEGLEEHLAVVLNAVVRARRHELLDYSTKRAAGSNLDAFDWQIRVSEFYANQNS
jgi:hypothetical protein